MCSTRKAGRSALAKPSDLLVGGVHGLSLFLEYLNNPQATADSFNAKVCS